MLLQIVDSVAKEEIVVGSCTVVDLLESNNPRCAVGDHKSMERHSSQSRQFVQDDEDNSERKIKHGVDMPNMELTLHSPVGGESLVYKWPLILGDERDESLEILETIRWVCRDVPELENILGKNEVHAMYDPRSFQGMKRLCDRYNGAINTLRQLKWISEKSPPTPSSSSSSSNYQFASTGLLKHILQVCYNRAVEDPDKLNQYEPFSPEVYGETSFELVEELMKVTMFGEDDVFIDLGSGVGQVVLQVAGSTPCKFCYGIEKSDWPARYSESLSSEYKKWMNFFGKYHSKFRLEKGDFLSEEKVDVINSASIIFVNNFAFGPQVDHQLKLRFANVKEGARIVSSRAFCPLNFHITDRNLSDIGTIMKVEELSALPAAVSWTDKPFAYFLHTIDRSLLEKYFNNLKTNSETGSRKVVNGERSKRKFVNGGSIKSESGDDVVRIKKPRRLNSDGGVEILGNQNKKFTKKTSDANEKRMYKLKLKKAGPKRGLTMKRGHKKLNSMTLSTLDIFHRQISSGSNSLDESNKAVFNDHWMPNHRTREDQITAAHLNGAVGPLKNLMVLFERQMMFFLQHMQTPTFKEELRKKVESEQRKSGILNSKISNLEAEVRLLKRHGAEIMNRKMNEFQPTTQRSNGFNLLKEAGSVMVDRTNLDRQVSHLKEHIAQLEHEQRQLANVQHPQSNGVLPTLLDLLTSPMNAPPRLNNNNITSNKITIGGAYQPEKFETKPENLLMDITEMLVRKNLTNSIPPIQTVVHPKKQTNKKTRAINLNGDEGNIPQKVQRKKKIKDMEAKDDHNNNITSIPSSFNQKQVLHHILPESVKLLQQQMSEEHHKSISQKQQTQLQQVNHGPTVTRKQPKNVDLQNLQQLQHDQKKLKFQHSHQEPLQQQESKTNQPRSRKRQIKVPQDQPAVGCFPHKLICNDLIGISDCTVPPARPQNQPHVESRDDQIFSSQTPFLSKLAAPNFAVVDFSQLIKNGGLPTKPLVPTNNISIAPSLNPPPPFPIPPHIFPPPNYMFFRPNIASAPLMSPLSKPLFSSVGIPISSPQLLSSPASFISFSSPLLSLPLFQPTNLISTTIASKPLHSVSTANSSSLQITSSSPLSSASSSAPPITAVNLTMKSSARESNPPILAPPNRPVTSDSSAVVVHDDNVDLKSLNDYNSSSHHQQSSSSSSVSSPSSGKSGGSSLENLPFEEQTSGMNEFVDNRKEVLASQ